MTKSFQEFIETEQVLEEGILRTGSIGVFAARSKVAGDKAQRAFQNARSALRGDMYAKSIEERLARLENAIDSMCEGLGHQRDQLGNMVSIQLTAALMKQSGRRKR